MTMIEILVVIAIIAILMGLIFAGLSYSLRSANVSQTKAILADLSAMVAEAELIKPLPDFLQEPTLNGRTDLEPYGKPVTVPGTTYQYIYVPQYLEVDVTPGDSRGHQPLDVAAGSGSIATQSITPNPMKTTINAGTNIPPYTASPAEAYTAYVLNKLSTLSKNQEILSKIPSTRFKQVTIRSQAITIWNENPPGSGNYGTQQVLWPSTGALPLTLPVPLDAWGNEIYFVPGGGLVNSNWGGNPGNFATAPTPGNSGGSSAAGLWSSVVVGTGAGGVPLYTVGTNPMTSPTGKAFWVSAGPDGDMLMGDDNIYSFTP